MNVQTMRRRATIAVWLLFLIAMSVRGQTRAEIEATAGKPVSVYSVSQSIWMTPEYGADGQVCRLRLYPKHFSGDTTYVGTKELGFDEFQHVVDVLVPVVARGAKEEPFESAWNAGGGVMWATFKYERVTITYSFGFRLDLDALRKSKRVKLGVAFPVSKPEKKEPNDDFANFHHSTAEIVTIVWNDRQCGS